MKNEQKICENFEPHIKFDKNWYKVKLPIKPNHSLLDDNYSRSEKRLKGLTIKFKNDPELQMDYNNIFSDQMKPIVTEEAPSHYIVG